MMCSIQGFSRSAVAGVQERGSPCPGRGMRRRSTPPWPLLHRCRQSFRFSSPQILLLLGDRPLPPNSEADDRSLVCWVPPSSCDSVALTQPFLHTTPPV